MSNPLKFYQGQRANLPAIGDPGAMYHCLDTKETYLALADGTLALYSTALTPAEMATDIANAIADADANKEFHGISAEHTWNGTVLTVHSASGTTSADLRGPVGDSGVYIGTGEPGEEDSVWIDPNGLATTPEDLKGPKGDPGDTYILTEQDKTDIVNNVLELIPKWTGGDF